MLYPKKTTIPYFPNLKPVFLEGENNAPFDTVETIEITLVHGFFDDGRSNVYLEIPKLTGFIELYDLVLFATLVKNIVELPRTTAITIECSDGLKYFSEFEDVHLGSNDIRMSTSHFLSWLMPRIFLILEQHIRESIGKQTTVSELNRIHAMFTPLMALKAKV